jgi:hypothetical protein
MIRLTKDYLKLVTLLRYKGPRHALGVALIALRERLMKRLDAAWEASLGVSFRETNICLDSLQIDSPNKQHGFSYVPCTGFAVRALLDSLSTDLSRYCFIDFGSGEGRSLIVASTYPFAQVMGVEFAKELHESAVYNINQANPVDADSGRLASVHMDATSFEIPRRDCVLYFYNPFGEAVFRQVLTNIERAHRECGSKYYVIFHQTRASLENNHTRNAELLRAAPFLTPCSVRLPTWWTRFLLGSQDRYIFESVDYAANDAENSALAKSHLGGDSRYREAVAITAPA